MHRRAAFSLLLGLVCGMHKHVQKFTDRWNQNIPHSHTLSYLCDAPMLPLYAPAPP